MGKITICGLGPADEKFLTKQTVNVIESGASYFRTLLHPAAAAFSPVGSFDNFYDKFETFDETYKAIASELIALSSTCENLVYVTPGSPLVQEDVVQLLIASNECDLEVLPAMSFLDLAWNRLNIDPVNSGVQLVDSHNFVNALNTPGPKLVSQIYSKNILSDIKLAVEDPNAGPAIVLQNLGLEDERVFEIPWDDLDRSVEPNNLTSLFIPELGKAVNQVLFDLIETITVLRTECPWDAKQTHETLIKHLEEETVEVVEAIEALDKDSGDGFMELEEELGDLLLQVLLHSEIAKGAGRFDIYNVSETLLEKMIRRHPHVFGDSTASTDEELSTQWQEIKAAERANKRP